MNTPSPFTPLAISGDTPRTRQPLHWRLLRHASTYLPLLLMLALALGTWWLAKNSLPPSDDTPVAAPRHEPDYEMQQFAVQRFAADGKLRAQIEGRELRHYPDTDTVEIDDVRVRAIDAEGLATVATAHRAEADGAGTEVKLLGQADVLSQAEGDKAPIHFRSEFLHAFLDTRRVFTDKPVTVVRGATEVRADGMEYTHHDEVVRFSGRARASFDPKARP